MAHRNLTILALSFPTLKGSYIGTQKTNTNLFDPVWVAHQQSRRDIYFKLTLVDADNALYPNQYIFDPYRVEWLDVLNKDQPRCDPYRVAR